MTSPFFIAKPASQYTFEQLAEIYNESRVDYIVPMPMNAKRLRDYVVQYDVDLGASVLAVNQDNQVAGIGMLGVRAERAWITRLGVIPTRRGRGVGQFIMEKLIENAGARGCTRAQLEVIDGNEAAHNLFDKLGFTTSRQLLVIRRPPGAPPSMPDAHFDALSSDHMPAMLAQRRDQPSWVDETRSVLAAGSAIEGWCVRLADGSSGWVVYRASPFQLSHIVMGSLGGELTGECARALLHAVHTQHARRDTKVENIPAQSPLWSAYQAFDYAIEFTRIEMFKTL